jgi:membrane protein involved in colicin uptake
VAKEAEAAAGDLLKRAREGKGPDLGAAQGDLARRLGGDLGRQVMAASPEALEQAQAEEDDFNRHMERAKTAGQMRREKAADAAKKARAATAEAKKTQAEVDRHTDAWAKEGEDFIADRERAAKAAPRLAREKAKQEQEAQTAALAQNIQRMAPRFEGIQFTPAQAKAAADQAMKSMEQQINADQAILMAMDGILNTMAKAGNRFANVQMQAVRAARQANGMGDFFDQKQPGAGNVGGN